MSEPQQSIVDTLQSFLDSRLTDVHTTIPGKIVSYDDTKERATVQPLIRVQRKVNDEIITVEIPPIENVPVMMLSTSKFILKFPVEKDDGCALFFSEVGIGNFLNGKGGIVDPDDLSRFSLTDAFCIPGLWGKNIPTGSPTIELTDNGVLNLVPDGKAGVTLLKNGSGNIELGPGTTTSLLNMLGASSPFVKGDLLSSNLTTYLTTVSTAAKLAVDPITVIASVQAIGVACDVFLAQVPTLNSVKIKGE